MKILASVHNKDGLDSFLHGISKYVDEIYASGGTCRFLNDSGFACRNISTLTGFEELLHGRVKTLHPAIFAGILSRRDPESSRQMQEHSFPEFDMVIVNLYPFDEAAKTHKLDDMIENIDIGGLSLLRAAAKNYDHVTVLSDPSQYDSISAELQQNGKISLETRKRLALKAFSRSADYDISIYGSMNVELFGTAPPSMYLKGTRGRELRYGENPDQKGYVYSDGTRNGIANAIPLQGKELSYNNILDADSAFETALEFSDPVAVVLKHNTPCGVSSAADINTALRKAIAADQESAYGSVIAINRKFDSGSLEAISKLFVEVIIAPEYDPVALEGLKKKKKNLRVLRVPLVPDQSPRIRSISDGFLVQSRLWTEYEKLEQKTSAAATREQIRDLEFAWKVVAHSRSNAIVLAKDMTTTGIGAGQTSRIEALKVAVERAGERSRGSVLASDAFFPFYDNVELAGKSGISAIIQPGGSIRDDEVIAKSEELDIPMYFTGKRVFLH